MRLKILDLFCGVGGVARGFHRFLQELGLDYEYVAVDVDDFVLQVHKKLNPRSIVVRRDALSFTIDELQQYDFVWASPPCVYYSKANYLIGRNVEDDTLWIIIRRLQKANTPFIVENVKIPKQKLKITPTISIDRHMFWSNLSLKKVKYKKRPKWFHYMTLRDLLEYHEITKSIELLLRRKGYHYARKLLRNMVDSTLAYNLAKLVIPQVLLYKKRGYVASSILSYI